VVVRSMYVLFYLDENTGLLTRNRPRVEKKEAKRIRK
jgi:hypothetical protein